jgi:hypothetical protein
MISKKVIYNQDLQDQPCRRFLYFCTSLANLLTFPLLNYYCYFILNIKHLFGYLHILHCSAYSWNLTPWPTRIYTTKQVYKWVVHFVSQLQGVHISFETTEHGLVIAVKVC